MLNSNNNLVYNPTMHLRALEGRRIGLVMVPFNLKDKVGTWWNQYSRFHLNLFPTRSLFYNHLFGDDTVGRAGLVDDDSLRFTPEGLYGEASVDEGQIGDTIMDLVTRGAAAGSTGAWPPRIRVRKEDGYVTDWPLVELSVCPAKNVLSLAGTTTVYHVRAFVPGSEKESDALDDGLALVRSMWIMPPEANGHQTETPAPATTGAGNINAPVTMTTEQIQQVARNAVEQYVATQPTRSLPAGGERPFGDQGESKITVSSPYDGVSLFALLCLDQMRAHNTARGRVHKREESFMRAILDKAGAIYDAEAKTKREAILTSPLRAIDDKAVEDVTALVPHFAQSHLRASEAMQSTLAGSGDELVPTLMNTMAWYAFRLESKVLGLLDTFEMPSNPYTWPTVSGGPTIRKVNEATDQSQANLGSSNRPASKPTTAAITFNCIGEGIGALMFASSVLFEDAGLNVAEAMATMWARNIADAIDAVLINASEDATATNIGHYGADPTGTVYDKILILNGLRYLGNAASDSVDLGGTLTIDKLTTVQQLMGARGVIGTDLANLFALVDPGVYYKLKALAEFRTRDKAGEDIMTIKNGFVGNWDGIPVVLSDQMEYMTVDTIRIPSTHNVTSGDAGGLLVVHRKMNKVGYMRHIQVEQGPVPHTGLYAMSGTVRLDLQAMEAGSVGVGYGVTI